MRYGIPLLRNRVSPRCTIADSVMLVSQAHGKLEQQRVIPLQNGAWTDLIRLLLDNQVDTLVAGGIDRETRQMLISYGLSVIDNVACSATEALQAAAQGTLQSGYGFSEQPQGSPSVASVSTEAGSRDVRKSGSKPRPWETQGDKLVRFDCLSCPDRVCMRGEACYPSAADSYEKTIATNQVTLEVARDISCEEDRQLCRVAELVYFCLGMKYSRIGLAYCIDLMEPAGVLAGLLRRFFDVFPVCCKVGGVHVVDPLDGTEEHRPGAPSFCVACNPVGQAEVLNRLNTDINVVVGLCVGVDCLFAQASQSPVSTLFVKDKSLVNNPIGALYSDYYLNEVSRTPSREGAQTQGGN